ncbi:MAG: RNA 3'-terminal phosphate cyclase, partial [Candidatus Aenigmatarchaeota archaeon]
MIEIDGSMGYGQLLRTSVALSALTLKPIKIFNIREGRPKPGLAAQHLMGVKTAGEFCNAEIKGLELGSTEIEFIPKSFSVTDRKIDIGTAGQISLLLQTLTPLLIFSIKEVTLDITGGTAGLGAPTIQFVKYVTFPLLSKLNIPLPEIEIIREGFYPRGGGRIKIKFKPVKKLNAINLTNPGKIEKIKGISIAGSLPEHIATRQAESARKYLEERNFKDVEIKSEIVETYSQGTSITLWAECENTVIGSDYIGKRGVRAETIGEECAKGLVRSLKSDAALDKFMSDQILIFLALAEGNSEVKVEEITEHCITNMRVCEQILGVKFKVDEKSKRIEVEGIGLENK